MMFYANLTSVWEVRPEVVYNMGQKMAAPPPPRDASTGWAQ